MSQDYITFMGPHHLLYLAILLVLTILIIIMRSHIHQHFNIWRWIIFIVSLCQQAMLYGTYLTQGFPLSEALLLHISRINSLLGIFCLLTLNTETIKIFTLLSSFAWLSFIYPSRVTPIYDPLGLSFLINHCVTVLLPYAFYFYRPFTLSKKDLGKTSIVFLSYLILVLVINPLVNGNYFYLQSKPIIPQAPTWLYLLVSVLIALILFIIQYLIFNRIITHKQVFIPLEEDL